MKRKILITSIVGVMLLTSCATNDGTDSSTSTQTVVHNVNVETKVETADEALKFLKEGNERFVNDKSELRNIDSQRRNSIKDGQSPYAIVVSCSDSRVTPTTVFNAGLGEIFDIRLAGNVVDDNALGSIEYGAKHLGSPLIVVMGHESCGAVTAAYNKVVKNEVEEGKLESIIKKIEPNVNKEGTIDEAVRNNIESVVKQISENDVIKELIDNGKVKVVGAYYDLDGHVTFNN